MRVNVSVCAKFSAEGGMIPTELIWKNGKRYRIERVTSVSRAPCYVEACLPVRYTCVLGGALKELYYEPQHEIWFVEAKI